MAIVINGTTFTYAADDLAPIPAVDPLVAVQEDVTKDFFWTVVNGTYIDTETVALALIPKGAIMFDWYVSAGNIGSVAGELGDTGTPTRYAASGTVVGSTSVNALDDGQDGVLPTNSVVVAANTPPFSAPYSPPYTADDVFVMTLTAGDTISNEGTTFVRGWIRYNLRGNVF